MPQTRAKGCRSQRGHTHCPPRHLLPKEHTVLPQDSAGREAGTTVRRRGDLGSQVPSARRAGDG